jgi:DNA polymerase III gamma/tau subunit
MADETIVLDPQQPEAAVPAQPAQAAPEAIEVDIVDDTPAQDRGRVRKPEAPSHDENTEIPEDELATYGDRVKKRISRLKFETHEERRAKEAAIRQAEEALNYARALIEENKRLKTTVSSGEKVLVENVKGRIEAEREKVRKQYKEAYDAGDAEGIVKAQEELARLAVETQRVKDYQPQAPAPEAQPEVLQPQFQPRQAPQPDPRAVEWAGKNKWFGDNKRMTSYAIAIHEDLLTRGVSPTSDEYYTSLDTEMRERFPEAFPVAPAPQAKPRPATVVAPASRVANGTPRKVQLTQTQAQLADRLGISREEYARQVLALEANNG